jgi:hypothetical protein
VGRLLAWQVYDRKLLEKIAQDMGLRTNLLESVDERRQSWMTEAMEGLLSASFATESGFSHHLVKTVLALGTHGECVIVGRGAAFILPPATALRVRLVGSVQERVAAWCQMRGISEQKAAEQVRTLDRQRADFLHVRTRAARGGWCIAGRGVDRPRSAMGLHPGSGFGMKTTGWKPNNSASLHTRPNVLRSRPY